METSAKLSMLRTSPRKVRLVADAIRGKKIDEAIAVLNNTDKRSSEPVLKLLNSAIANAVNNDGAEADKLFVKTILVNEGPTLKRFRPKDHGKAFEILKRTSHITIVVSDEFKK
ncbi:50S ribosomal protein L22 [Spiroplasma sp. TIUS-1]|uniref:50S ribosomal protein L22 n=1 Tax=Spiroplasma sp. TIUS-1 TaxID=216963 RepID=UPI001399162E|nr:50S ribosomal protein L22 [Spiroplasma sp. TIUS-1]QHX36177.1 50S ribosomal protein L22 [Spiroplasma sp. TIUS-1]